MTPATALVDYRFVRVTAGVGKNLSLLVTFATRVGRGYRNREVRRYHKRCKLWCGDSVSYLYIINSRRLETTVSVANFRGISVEKCLDERYELVLSAEFGSCPQRVMLCSGRQSSVDAMQRFADNVRCALSAPDKGVVEPRLPYADPDLLL